VVDVQLLAWLGLGLPVLLSVRYVITEWRKSRRDLMAFKGSRPEDRAEIIQALAELERAERRGTGSGLVDEVVAKLPDVF
jgi:hypothetical protein